MEKKKWVSKDKINGFLYSQDNRKSEASPMFKGKCDINVDLVQGQKMEISAWQKTDRNGVEFLSFAINDPYQKPEGNSNNF